MYECKTTRGYEMRSKEKPKQNQHEQKQIELQR